MVDHTANQLALRARALALVVCTTGSTTLGASTVGYTRTAGSFVTDGFHPGMEVTPAGFATNNPKIITKVEALLLTISGGLTAESAAAGRTLSVGYPLVRFYENTRGAGIAGRPYAEEDYVPGTGRNLGITSGGTIENTGLYVIRWYGLSGYGLPAITKSIDALLNQFTPGSSLSLGGGIVVRIRGDVAPSRSQLRAAAEGWHVVTATIPWRVHTLNPSS